jgi:hypothetical protein
LCRFEVIVRDNDGNNVPSARDYFSITLSDSAPAAVGPGDSVLGGTVFYTRAGFLQGGNLTVD